MPAALTGPRHSAVQLEHQRAKLWAAQLVRLQRLASVHETDKAQSLQCWEIQCCREAIHHTTAT